jgi:ABC-type transport system substrate-binding protein
MGSYWKPYQVNRRTALRASAAAAAGFGLLAAGCSALEDADDSSSRSLTKAVDTTKSARPGGTFRSFIVRDAQGFSPAINAVSSRVVVWRAYSRLTSIPPNYLDEVPAIAEANPDLAESWEFSGDKQQVTFKLRPNAKWDARPPTSGRVVDAEDVVFSWKQFETLNSDRQNLAYAANRAAPVLSVQALDRATVIMKLQSPTVDIFDAMAPRFWLMPREGDGGIDLRAEVRGSGAWTLKRYEPSVGFTFEKNPNWYRSDLPIAQTWEVPILPEYAQRLAQLKSGNLFHADVRREDVLSTKQDAPDLNLYQDDYENVVGEMRFGLASASSPFWDERVRRAMSMLLDRDTFGNVFSSVDAFKASGIDVAVRWNTHLGKSFGLDPRSSEFGRNGQYYRFDVPEARKLLGAAGYPNGFATRAYFRSGEGVNQPQFEAVLGMLSAGGVTASINVWDSTTEFIPRVFNEHGNFEGLAFHPGIASPLIDAVVRKTSSGGAQFPGFDGTGGRDRLKGDPEVDRLTLGLRQEFDSDRRLEMAKDFARYMGGKQYSVVYDAGGPQFALMWPCVGNALVYRALVTELNYQESDIFLWIDPSKPPLSKQL